MLRYRKFRRDLLVTGDPEPGRVALRGIYQSQQIASRFVVLDEPSEKRPRARQREPAAPPARRRASRSPR